MYDIVEKLLNKITSVGHSSKPNIPFLHFPLDFFFSFLPPFALTTWAAQFK